jgi:exoribonuclease R
VSAALEALPAEMAVGARRGNTVERECVDLLEAVVLQDRIGELFDAVVVDLKDNDPSAGTVQLEDPAVVARIDGDGTPLPLGERLQVRLTEADPARAKVRFTPA